MELLGTGKTAIQRAMESPGEFARLASKHKWRMAAHHRALDIKLIRLADGTIRRMMVMEPPRHGKSEHASKYFSAWYLGKYPSRQIILGSATDDLATEFSLAAR